MGSLKLHKANPIAQYAQPDTSSRDRSTSLPPAMINTAHPPLASRSQRTAAGTAAVSSDVAKQVSVHFWGVRGSVPTPSAANQRYGGNTLCTEISIGGQRIIFDSGTGIVSLGQHLQQQKDVVKAHILFTHTQWDRIQGFPFFQPAFFPHNHFTVYGGTAPNGASIKHCLTDQMLQPHYTMPLQNMLARLTFKTLSDRTRFNIGDIEVNVLKINPVTEALGYRLSYHGYSLVYATDTPNGPRDPQADDIFLELADSADILIYDGTYSDLRYLHHNQADTDEPRWETGIDIAKEANVKKLVLVHHSPVQNDTVLDQLQKDISDRFPAATVAYEGMVL
ncbi:MAG: MBL fold metallo-hydrolase [Cyanobacteria bacterium J06634_6]